MRLQTKSGLPGKFCVTKASHGLTHYSVDGSDISEACSTVGTSPSSACPASEWYALRDYFFAQEVQYSVSREQRVMSLESCLIHGQISARNLIRGTPSVYGTNTQLVKAAMTPQAVVSDALSATVYFGSGAYQISRQTPAMGRPCLISPMLYIELSTITSNLLA